MTRTGASAAADVASVPGPALPSAGAPGLHGPAASTADDVQTRPWLATVLIVLLISILLTQRLLLPLGATPIQLSIVLTFGVAAVLVVTRQLVVDRFRAELLGLVAALCLALTLAATWLGATPSITSLGLLLVLYVLFTLKAAPGGTDTLIRLARGFVLTMVVFALVATLQLASQLAGVWQYVDYLGEGLPPDVLALSYNTNIPLAFGSSVYKANAFVFLEPSFLSQFCALAAIVAVVIHAAPWKVLILVAGMFASVSGTGIILLICGGALVVLRAPWLIRPVHLVVLGGAGVAVLASPVAPLLLDRIDETGQVGSSGYLRFVQPYTEVIKAMQAEPLYYLTGAGAGSVQRLLPSMRGGESGQAVVYTIIPKLVFEYGLLAGGLFVVFILLVLLDGGAWRVVPGSVLVMIFLLSGSLLQPHTLVTAWLLTGLWSHRHGPRIDRMDRRQIALVSTARASRRPPSARPLPLLLD